MKKTLALLLSSMCALPSPGQQGQQSIAPEKPRGPVLIRPYLTPYVPPIRLNNSNRIASLMRGGKLYLTAQDAIALALENNLDVEIARYNPILDEWRLTRSEAGGALPGVPTGTSQVGSVASGQGVSGSQAAAGVKTTGGGSNGNGTANATITQIGPVTPSLDPVVQDSSVFSHLSHPQADLLQSVVANLIQNERNYSTSIQDGLITGGQVSMTYTESYLKENAPTDVLNPSEAPNLSISIQHNFLSGFGVGVNSRTIEVSKLNLKVDDLNFKSEIISIVVTVLQQYFALAADYQDLGAKQRALDVAQQFLANNRKQVEIGTMAPLDVTNAESNVATSESDLVVSRAKLQQDQLALKNLISRTGALGPLLDEADIIPLDHIEVPERDNLPPFNQLVTEAQTNRVDIAAERMNLDIAKLNAKGTRNGVLPQLTGFASASNAGLTGNSQPVPVNEQVTGAASGSTQYPPGFGPCPGNPKLACEFPDPSLVGGLTNALDQIFERHYPSESGGAYFYARLRNRQNQADYQIDQLSMRQTELQTQKDVNQVAVDVANQVTALRQALARYEAAVKNRVLEEQLLDAEQKKFGLGASTPYNVVTQQRDLATAESTEVAALVAYSNAKVALDQTLGTTLKVNNVSIAEAQNGRIERVSALPDKLPDQR